MAQNRGLPIWLIFAYFIVFMLILVVLSIFHKNGSGRSYANFKFFTYPILEKKFITLLFMKPNRTRFSALDSPWKTKICQNQRTPVPRHFESPWHIYSFNINSLRKWRMVWHRNFSIFQRVDVIRFSFEKVNYQIRRIANMSREAVRPFRRHSKPRECRTKYILNMILGTFFFFFIRWVIVCELFSCAFW